VTIAERLLQHVGFGLRTEDRAPALAERQPSLPDQAASSISVVSAGDEDGALPELRRDDLESRSVVGLSELRAAAVMVAEGQATRVILAGFPTWPGLLTEIERLSRELDLSILPTIVRGGGRVDLVVSPAGGDDR
jgi:hypothetical protein